MIIWDFREKKKYDMHTSYIILPVPGQNSNT